MRPRKIRSTPPSVSTSSQVQVHSQSSLKIQNGPHIRRTTCHLQLMGSRLQGQEEQRSQLFHQVRGFGIKLHLEI